MIRVIYLINSLENRKANPILQVNNVPRFKGFVDKVNGEFHYTRCKVLSKVGQSFISHKFY